MKQLLLKATLLFVLTVNLAFAQQIDSVQINEMKKVQWLTGKWKGDGWIMFGPGQKHPFSQTETISSKLNGILLTIEGLGINHKSDEGKPKIVHQAFAVLSYDSKNQKFKMRAYKSDGAFVDADAEIDENGNFIWGFNHPYAGEIRFTIKQNEKGQWHETGEVSRDKGKTWFQNFEMILNKIE